MIINFFELSNGNYDWQVTDTKNANDVVWGAAYCVASFYGRSFYLPAPLYVYICWVGNRRIERFRS